MCKIILFGMLLAVLASATVDETQFRNLCDDGEEVCRSTPVTIEILSEKFEILSEKFDKFLIVQEISRKAYDEKFDKFLIAQEISRKADLIVQEISRKAYDEKFDKFLIVQAENRKADLIVQEISRKAYDEKFDKFLIVQAEIRKADNEKYEKNREDDRTYIYDLVKNRQHDIHNEVAAHLENVTIPLKDLDNNAGNKFNSGHFIYHEERFMFLSVSHGVKIENSYSCHDEIDVQISGGCPNNSAINVSTWALLRTGDQASTFGFINEYGYNISRFWKGSLAGMLGYTVTHQESQTRFLEEEYVFQGIAQLLGMSGGPTLNGIGCTGMVHGNNIYLEQNVSMACVIPFSLIKSKCIDKMRKGSPDYFDKLKTPSDCISAKVINAPRF